MAGAITLRSPRRLFAAAALAAALAGCDTREVAPSEMRIWQVDSLVKVFEDSRPPVRAATLLLEAARNEVISAQVAVRAGRRLTGLRCRVGPIHGPEGASIAGASVRFVGYVPVEANSDASALRRAPARFPDPLLEDAHRDLPAYVTQPLWITLHVPPDARPGLYGGEVLVLSAEEEAALPLLLRVYPPALPDERTLWVSNWLSPRRGPLMQKFAGAPWSPEDEGFWRWLGVCAEKMAAHRQTVVYTPTLELTRVGADEAGRLTFDFARFDRWVELFARAGVIGRIEGRHLAHGPYDGTEHHSLVYEASGGKAARKSVSAWSEAHEAFLSEYLPALEAHLAEKGWLERYVQHLMDEPTPKNRHCYAELSGMVRRHGPRIRILEALRCQELIGAVDVWVPLLSRFVRDRDFYRARQQDGDEVWFYTCLGPRRPYMNRFIDYPLLKVRLLHWLNARYGATGYLHWGWAHWTSRPFQNTERHEDFRLPPGDSFIVYPQAGRVLDSIRHEAMLEGIQDYELLKLLGARSPGRARRIVRDVVPSARRYTTDPQRFRAARRALLEALCE